MKIPALLTFLLAAVLSALPMSQARAEDVSFDVFYNSLGDQGDWYNTPDYGYVWQPSIAYQNDKWRPYTDGYWAQTDDGWTWVSYENFGWATYHYGRWTQLEDTGWVWVPGYQWGPGWVSWRTNDDYVGWAPLPPKQHPAGNQGGGSISIDYNDVEPDEGYNTEVDQQYDIGPGHYCFVPVHSFGAPVLSEVILPPTQNIVIIENTINVTNIVYQNNGGTVIIINNGPNYQYLSHHVDHPLPHLILEHHNDLNFLHEHIKGGNPMVVKNGTLFVPSPYIEHRRVDFNQTKPLKIKQQLAQPKIEHGWRNTGADPQTIQRVRQQFQQQAREHPTHPPGNPAATMTPPAADPHQHERDARATPPVPVATPAATSTPPRGNSDADKRARRDAAQREKEAREAQNNGGEPTPGGRPSAPPHTTPSLPGATPAHSPRHAPNAPDVTHEPTAAPTPARETNPNREPRTHGPGNPPASTPAATPREEHRPSRPPSEPAATEETHHTPHQQERTQPAATPVRNTEAETERHPVRTQTPPPAPRPEVREEPRRSTETPPPAPRPEARETRPRPQPTGTTEEDKNKKRDPQQ